LHEELEWVNSYQGTNLGEFGSKLIVVDNVIGVFSRKVHERRTEHSKLRGQLVRVLLMEQFAELGKPILIIHES
jgi:hypothetical protein